MKTTWKILLMVAVLIGPTLHLVAQERRQMGDQRQRAETRQHRNDFNMPDLTEEQKSQMKDLRLQMHKSLLPMQNQIGEYDAKMRTLTTAEQADMKAINKVIDNKTDVLAKMMKLKAENHQKMRAILTDEQRVIFDTRSRDYARNGRNRAEGKGQMRFEGRKW